MHTNTNKAESNKVPKDIHTRNKTPGALIRMIVPAVIFSPKIMLKKGAVFRTL